MKKKNDEIVISKTKLIKGIIISLGIILLLVICGLASSNTEEYSKNSSSSESSDESVYDIAVGESASVKDSERESPKEISVNDYLELYKGKENKLVLISRPTCQYCQIATPIIENLIYKYGIEINYLNSDEFSEDDSANLVASDEYFSEGYGTPLLLVVGNSQVVDKVEGLTDSASYIEFFKKYEFME